MGLLILGGGWVGRALGARHPGAVFTNRQGRDGGVRFDLADPSTWAALPAADACVWTFPAAPPELAIRLYEQRFATTPVIVLGSTSAYRATTPDEEIDETSPLDVSQPRVAGEEALRARGAAVLRLAGLWGPGRDPVRWLLGGRIAQGDKYVNLAHLDDVLAAIEAVLARFEPGLLLNVCDGAPRRWREHVTALRQAGVLPASFTLPEGAPGPESRRVSNASLRARLPGHPFRRFTESE